MRFISWVVVKVGLSDLVVECGIVIVYRIKGMLGIIGWLCLSVYSDGVVWYFDVGLLYFGVVVGFKGLVFF